MARISHAKRSGWHYDYIRCTLGIRTAIGSSDLHPLSSSSSASSLTPLCRRMDNTLLFWEAFLGIVLLFSAFYLDEGFLRSLRLLSSLSNSNRTLLKISLCRSFNLSSPSSLSASGTSGLSGSISTRQFGQLLCRVVHSVMHSLWNTCWHLVVNLFSSTSS